MTRSADPYSRQRGDRAMWGHRVPWKLLAGLCVAAMLLLAGLVGASKGHDFYTKLKNPVSGVACCGGYDCAPFPAERVKVAAGGYLISPPGHVLELVPYGEVLPSPDGEYHDCRRRDGTRRCFIAPLPGS